MVIGWKTLYQGSGKGTQLMLGTVSAAVHYLSSFIDEPGFITVQYESFLCQAKTAFLGLLSIGWDRFHKSPFDAVGDPLFLQLPDV